jgi:hypothetical protein
MKIKVVLMLAVVSTASSANAIDIREGDEGFRNAALGKLAGCGMTPARSTFFQGEDGGDQFWSVLCRNGQSYAVVVKPDGTGTSLDCAMMKFVAGVECFKNLQ